MNFFRKKDKDFEAKRLLKNMGFKDVVEPVKKDKRKLTDKEKKGLSLSAIIFIVWVFTHGAYMLGSSGIMVPPVKPDSFIDTYMAGFLSILFVMLILLIIGLIIWILYGLYEIIYDNL